MLYNYAKYKSYNTTYSNTALNKFSDASSISSVYLTAMKWAVSKGIINGKTTTTIVPKGKCTRAEMGSNDNEILGSIHVIIK